MKFLRLTHLLLLLPITFANAGENALSRIEQSCVKYPTPEARADCEKSKKESMAAFETQKKAAEKASTDVGEPKKKNDLCFTRKATGEVVCPN